VVCERTWPNWPSKDFRKGCEEIISTLNLAGGGSEEVAYGVTKIFIKHPEVVFALEEKREQRVWGYAIKIQNFFTVRVGRHKFYHSLQMRGFEIVKNGGKERRRLSFERTYKSDYSYFSRNHTLQEIIERYGEDKAVFTESVWVYNVKGDRSKRTLALTNAAIYFFALSQRPQQPNSARSPRGGQPVNLTSEDFYYAISRRIPILDITGISCSKKADNFFVIHVMGQHCHVVQGRRKTELFASLNMLVSEKVEIRFEDKITAVFKSGKAKKSKTVQKVLIPTAQGGAPDGGVLDPKTFTLGVEAGLPATSVPNFKTIVSNRNR